MSSRPSYDRVREVFQTVVEAPASERNLILNRDCGTDAELRTEVESLLELDAIDDAFSEDRLSGSGLAGGFSSGTPEAAQLPDRIGKYQIVQRLGQGGMADVYEARQDAPDRRVALKVMHAGTVGGGAATRFAREGRIQASLHHPGIAQVYEAGVHDDHGRAIHYFAMELVDGTAITEFCASRELTLRAKLELMIGVCEAVNFAHQRGVIHRDLKPSNILVALAEESGSAESPRAKVLDFGIAKLIGLQSRTATMHTREGQLVGTLAYMSPEQIAGKGDEVDTRSDIYSLGLVLYELLAGRPAHQVSGLSIPEAARLVSEHDPARLSAASREFRGDIETIVHKAIARDKARRYDSASEFAADIRRYLNNEPVSARPATAMYHARKFAARNRAVVMTGMLAVLALVAGVVGTTLQARAADEARADAELKAIKASHESEVSKAVAEALRNVFYLSTPSIAQGKDPSLREAIFLASEMIQKEFKGPPEAEAIVRNVLGIVFRNFAEFERSREQFEIALEIRRRVLPPNDPDLADSIHNMALTLSIQGKSDESIDMFRQALEIQIAGLGPDDPKVVRSMYNLARNLMRAKRFPEARVAMQNSLEAHRRVMADNREVIAMHVSTLGSIERMIGNFPEAERIGREALDLMREATGDNHPSLAIACFELAESYLADGKAKEAEVFSREAYEVAEFVFAATPNHGTAAALRASRARVLRAQGREAEAIEVENKHAAKTEAPH